MASNYRGITVLSVVNKFYISIIKTRLSFWSDAYNRVVECQAGFRVGYSTIDNLFMLVVNRILAKKVYFWHLLLNSPRRLIL